MATCKLKSYRTYKGVKFVIRQTNTYAIARSVGSIRGPSKQVIKVALVDGWGKVVAQAIRDFVRSQPA